jgi:cGMP-dependent protein kinase
LDDFKAVAQLGNGMFGSVILVQANASDYFALKTVSREKIEAYRIHNSLVLEREILLQLDCSMIMKLIRTYKDEKRLYFLAEFVSGSDLFDIIRDLGLLKDEEAKFYTACLLWILDYLHDRDIIYRDLKPENVMVGQDGYPKLIDFGSAII